VPSQYFKTLLAPEMAEVDRVLRASLDSDVALIRQVADYIIGGGGKRLRPALVLLSARACGYEGPHRYTLAAGEVTQEDGVLTDARPAGVLHSATG